MEDWLTYPGSTLLEGNENEDWSSNQSALFQMRAVTKSTVKLDYDITS